MFNNLTNSLGKVFDRLKGKGYLGEEDVSLAMREVRVALLEADVSLPVVKDFIARVKEKATGQEVIKSVSPAQMVIKIVQDELESVLGGEEEESALNLNTTPPAVIMMVGLQGSGKTTSCAKISMRLKNRDNRKILMASLDIYRPAAQQQLATLGVQAQIDTLPIIEGEKPEKITRRALEKGRLEGYDIVMLDTAGRLHIDTELMDELDRVKKLASPAEILLVADSLTGQDAVNVAGQFHGKLGVTGIVLTRIDGDARGGAALSMRAVTGCPVKYLGVGEKLSELEEFHPKRIATRILDMGDVVSLVEKAAETVSEAEAKKLEKKMRKGQFDFDDLHKQLDTIRKMGGMGGIMNLLPGMGKMKEQVAEADIDEKMLVRQQAIITSMTMQERRNPKLMNASRKRRIAAGSGVTIQDVNRLLKQFKQMQMMMKKVGRMSKKDMMRGGLKGLMPR